VTGSRYADCHCYPTAGCRHYYATSKRNIVISVVTVSYSENKPTTMHGEYTTHVSPVTNPSQCRNEPWDKVLTIPSAHAHFKTGISESRVNEPAGVGRESVSQPAKTAVSSRKKNNESSRRIEDRQHRELIVNSVTVQ
jgi:hypothetical protein